MYLSFNFRKYLITSVLITKTYCRIKFVLEDNNPSLFQSSDITEDEAVIYRDHSYAFPSPKEYMARGDDNVNVAVLPSLTQLIRFTKINVAADQLLLQAICGTSHV